MTPLHPIGRWPAIIADRLAELFVTALVVVAVVVIIATWF